MKALILTNGACQGIYSNLRGEGRWALAVAQYLSLLNYDVYVPNVCQIDLNYVDKQPKNINFLPISYDSIIELGPYDVCFCHFNLALEDPSQFEKIKDKCKRFLWGTFWPGSISFQLPENQSYVTPYRTYEDQNLKIPLLPIVDIKKEVPNFNKKTIMWTVRNPCTNCTSHPYAETNLKTFEATLQLALEGYKIIIGCSEGFYGNAPDAAPLSEEYLDRAKNTWNQLELLPNVVFLKQCPLDKFLLAMDTTSITIPCNGGSSIPHALIKGKLPLILKDWGLNFTTRETLGKLGINKEYGSFTKEEIYARLKDYLEHEESYLTAFSILVRECPYYDIDDGVKMLKEILTDQAIQSPVFAPSPMAPIADLPSITSDTLIIANPSSEPKQVSSSRKSIKKRPLKLRKSKVISTKIITRKR